MDLAFHLKAQGHANIVTRGPSCSLMGQKIKDIFGMVLVYVNVMKSDEFYNFVS